MILSTVFGPLSLQDEYMGVEAIFRYRQIKREEGQYKYTVNITTFATLGHLDIFGPPKQVSE